MENSRPARRAQHKDPLAIALERSLSDLFSDYIVSPPWRRGHWLEIGIATPQIHFKCVLRDGFGGIDREESDIGPHIPFSARQCGYGVTRQRRMPVDDMNIIYSSDNYYVVEYPAQHGFELVDKRTQRGTFFQGDVAERFAQSMQEAVATEATVEDVDEFLGTFGVLLDLPLVYH